MAFDERSRLGSFASPCTRTPGVFLRVLAFHVICLFMTVATMSLGLIPIMWSTGTGADVMNRNAAPLIGGLVTSFLLELIVYAVVYEIWKWHFEVKKRLSIEPAR